MSWGYASQVNICEVLLKACDVENDRLERGRAAKQTGHSLQELRPQPHQYFDVAEGHDEMSEGVRT